MRGSGWLLVVLGRGPAECGSGWPERWLLVVCLVREWGGVAHSSWGADRGGGVVPTVSHPRGTSGDRMNVQRGRRRTFIPSPGARAVWRIRVILAFTDRGL